MQWLLLLVWVALRDLGDSPFHWTLMSDLMLFPIYMDAFGKPQDTVARVRIGQVAMAFYTKRQNKDHVNEALHRGRFKFPGHQKIHISKKALLSLMRMILKVWRLKSSLSQSTVESNTSIIVASWTNSSPFTHESLRLTPRHSHPPVIPISCPPKDS